MCYIGFSKNNSMRREVMKKIILAIILSLAILTISQGLAQEKPRLGVLRFTNDTRAGW
jgi:hypothetical protein